jgi:hypothetical protein
VKDPDIRYSPVVNRVRSERNNETVDSILGETKGLSRRYFILPMSPDT